MAENKGICVLCGDIKDKSELSVLAEIRGICGHDLGFVCKECIEHIDSMQYFQRIKEGADNE